MRPDPDDTRDDQLETLLGNCDGIGADNRLQEAIFNQTTSVIRFRRRMKRCGLAAGMVACYLAGVMTMSLPQRTDKGDLQQSVQLGAEPGPSLSMPTPAVEELPHQPDRDAGPVNVSRQQSFQRLADISLLEQGDVKSALRNYKYALAKTPTDQRAIVPGQDSWLLMALKEATLQEMRNDQSSDK